MPAVVFSALFLPAAHSADARTQVVRAANNSTLDQEDTHPFHLRATLKPSFARDAASNRTGEIEIWWQSPGTWHREVRCPEFHQVMVVMGGHVMERHEGNYFPEWLRETAEALVQPLSKESAARKGVRPDKETNLAGSLYLNWEKDLPMDQQLTKQVVNVRLDSDLLLYDGGLGWGGSFHDYARFHGKMIARTVTHGTPEVKATVNVLEDLPADYDHSFSMSGSSSDPVETVIIDELGYMDALLPGTAPPVWPPVADGPLKGVVWTEMTIDRDGVPREVMNAISDNPGINDAATAYFKSLRFKPIMKDGHAVQVVRKIAIPFVLKRPAGMADLGSAKEAFERGRKATAPAYSATRPYILQAKVSTGITGTMLEGTYTDTWRDGTHWRREAVLGGSHVVRARDGDRQYLMEDGPNPRAARFILTAVEPIPATDTMTESDWRLRKAPMEDAPALLVMRGEQTTEGVPSLENSWPFWFGEDGRLLRTYVSKIVMSYEKPRLFDGIQVPTQISGRSASGQLVFRLSVEELRDAQASELGSDVFRIPGHEWKRQFTAEVR